MSPKTSRLTGELSSNPKMVELSHDPTVTTAKNAPIANATCEGLGRGRRRCCASAMRPLTLVADVAQIRFPQACRHRAQDLVREARHLVEHAEELALAQDEHLHVRVGHDGGRARAPVEQRQLAEVLPGAELGDLAVLALDRRRPVHDEEELVAGAALLDEDAPGLHVDLVGRPGDLREVLLARRREQRDLGQVIQVPIRRRHGRTLAKGERFTPGKQRRNKRSVRSPRWTWWSCAGPPRRRGASSWSRSACPGCWWSRTGRRRPTPVSASRTGRAPLSTRTTCGHGSSPSTPARASTAATRPSSTTKVCCTTATAGWRCRRSSTA